MASKDIKDKTKENNKWSDRNADRDRDRTRGRDRDREEDNSDSKDRPSKRGRRYKDEEEESGVTKILKGNLQDSTLESVWGILLFVVAIFFLLAAFNKGGTVGVGVHDFFGSLLGIGYYLIPTILILLSISFFGDKNRSFTLHKLVGAIVFLVSGLGLFSLISIDSGGSVGKVVATPLINLFDYPTSFIITIALVIISILIVFDASLKKEHFFFWRLFGIGKKKEGATIGTTVTDANLKITNDGKEVGSKEATEEAVGMLSALKNKFGGANNADAGKNGNVNGVTASDPNSPNAQNSQNAQNAQNNGNKNVKNDVEEGIELRTKNTFTGKVFVPPPLSILETDKGKPGVGDIKANANIIKRTLQNFGIDVEMDEVSIGPSVTRYALKPAEGVKLSKIIGLQNNLALALAAHPIRIEAPIPGKSLVGIEIPNSVKTTVGLGTLLAHEEFQKSDKPLMVALGKGISGKTYFHNLAKMPHLLVAGATGSGKSVTIHALVSSLLYRNSSDHLKFIMIDPKRVELTLYNKIPHLLTPVITDAKKAILALRWAAKEMERRYHLLEKNSVRDIDSYHKTILNPELERRKNEGFVEGEEAPDTMPYIVIIIDELADIMQAYPRELEAGIVRLAQMSRAVGIHLIISTQRPSVNVITGLIKANVPARIALQVASQIDSRTILDMRGAEELLGAGDMLWLSGDMSTPVRIQSAFVSEGELKKLVKHIVDSSDVLPQEISFSGGDTAPSPTADPVFNSSFSGGFGDDSDDADDDLYDEAKQLVIEAGKASTSYIQRKLRVGYARAARLMDILEEKGIIGPSDGAKPREVIGYGGQKTDGSEGSGLNSNSGNISGANNANNMDDDMTQSLHNGENNDSYEPSNEQSGDENIDDK